MKNPLLRPWLTEKSTGLTEKKGQYVFKVKLDADKTDIKKAIEEKFGVVVKSVRTVNCLGKSKRQFTRKGVLQGKKSDWKKAIVTLAKDQSIDYYSGSTQKGEG
ncbi:50S ribosomal protein L23 [Chlorobium phaeobacteroides]|jgi:large subunit ribosomal protein L23|uniref:Large ribosomal subunit protein uL23 n=1 Tax=Chlorobium phaeobacteroides (strain DSM 266 / SMG 266 / 2430) TaxID=290317 RepID=RL23_CHLPD|nr:50S ribosomal protein L23 [Chlorobium phaeobacteroides]A1BJ32.1 RecName: Full=Large ribosomal subunit protein uL23; AltName: Full=50S ribosomal protein L23 [Chlorobium phaeobacteroides DSM 266]ABL66409.1 LSU ribosomal protein L23P [Chlorobium phaeobacteroides DSM 266]MBV5319564.1 50S ribosomal protein L23 [Chlorobium phaeobacteroides]